MQDQLSVEQERINELMQNSPSEAKRRSELQRQYSQSERIIELEQEKNEFQTRVKELETERELLSPILNLFYTCTDCGQLILRSQSKSRCVEIGGYESLCRSCWSKE